MRYKVHFPKRVKLSMPEGDKEYAIGNAFISEAEFNAYKNANIFRPIEKVDDDEKETKPLRETSHEKGIANSAPESEKPKVDVPADKKPTVKK